MPPACEGYAAGRCCKALQTLQARNATRYRRNNHGIGVRWRNKEQESGKRRSERRPDPHLVLEERQNEERLQVRVAGGGGQTERNEKKQQTIPFYRRRLD